MVAKLSERVKQLIMRRRRRNGHGRNRRGRIIGRRRHSPIYGHHAPKAQCAGNFAGLKMMISNFVSFLSTFIRKFNLSFLHLSSIFKACCGEEAASHPPQPSSPPTP
jgi:hypothetical protein